MIMKKIAFFLVAAAIASSPVVSLSAPTSQNRADYEAFKNKARKQYTDFRDKANAEYAEFLRKAWKDFQMQPGETRPERKKVVPEVYVEDGDSAVSVSLDVIELQDTTAGFREAVSDFFSFAKRRAERLINKHLVKKKKREAPVDKPIAAVSPVKPEPVPPEPKPVLPAEEKPVVAQQSDDSFSFYGTRCSVKRPQDKKFAIGLPTNENIADAWLRLSKDDYLPMLTSCLAVRDSLKLNDWGYLQMLDSVGRCFYGDTNEGRLLTAFLFAQSGYSMRLTRSGKTIGMMFPSKYTIYRRPYVKYDGMRFYDYNNGTPNIQLMPEPFNNESDIRLFYDREQNLSVAPAAKRRIVSERYPEMDVEVTVNKNVVDFYNEYPDGENENNSMTRFSIHANVPLDSCVRASLYPALRSKIKGLSKLEATERLLNWVQTGFVYEFDNVVWGQDRAFFAEETLFYPYCDCEDRAILFSRLIRDLVGLEVALVYYPGHLATAVNFGDESDNAKGSYITLDDKKFVICDPTYIGATVGMEMTCVDNTKIQAVVL